MDSFLSWVGGKKLLRNKIVDEFPESKSYENYVEVFGGAGWVLFYKDRHALKEVYNDINSDLVNLFKYVKYHTPELQRELNFMINSRALFEEYLSQIKAKGLTDIQRAARYYILVKLSYGSSIDSYGAVKKDVEKMKLYIEEIQKRLSNVVIENRSFEEILKKYDSETTLFYLDPPYYTAENYYNVDFNDDHHRLLLENLKDIKGKFLLSYNDHKEIRKQYKDFKIKEVERNNNLTARYNKNKRYQELIITNY